MGRRLGVLRRAVVVAVIVVAALFAFSASAFAADNTGCLTCHGPSMSMPVPDVDRDTACQSCHVGGLVGTHPYHQPGANCGAACHPGWGDSLMTAVPSYTDPVSGASFTSANSKSTSPAILHIIHSDSRWPEGVDTSFSACSSCHAPAACTACHVGAASANHADHSATGNANYAAQSPWTGLVGHGVVGGNQTQHTAGVETNQCASAGCHDAEGTKGNRPHSVEDYNYGVGGNPEDPTGSSNAISVSGSWRYKANSLYSGSRMSYNNVAGSQLTATFTGKRVEIVSDKDPYRGEADVYLDGVKVATFDSYNTSTVYQAIVYSSDILSDGAHTISVRPLNQKGGPAARATYVVVDCFRVYADVPDSIAPECLSCHGDKSTGHGATFSHEATHTAGLESGFACTSCHSMSMFTEHARTSSKTTASSCSACHTTYAPFTLNSYDFTCGGTATALDGAAQPCHNNAGEQKHDFVDSNHDASAGANGTDCKACHGTDLSIIHTEGSARAHDTELSANTFSVSCLSCHGTTVFPATKDCTSSLCHDASFGGAAVTIDNHVPVAHPATNNGQSSVTSTGGFACSTCHTMELTGEHAKTSSLTSPGNAAIACSNCHSATYLPTNWLDTLGTTNTCISCHGVGSGAPSATGAGEPHEAADYAAKHDFRAYGTNAASCGPGAGLYCHNGSSPLLGEVRYVDTLHAASKPGNANCTSCHSASAPPSTYSCATVGCHPVANVPHNKSAKHDARSVTYAENASCLSCHADFTDLIAHGGCAKCHGSNILTASDTRYLVGTFTARCIDCHNTSLDLDGAGPAPMDYAAYDPNHYEPYEANHTATGMTASIGNKTCVDCHQTMLKAEHAITLSASGDMSVNCIECHTDTTLGSAAQVAANWANDACSDCHTATHNTMAADHTLTGNASCAGAGCHTNTDNLATLHAAAVNGADTSCNVCHTSGADTDLSSITGCDSCHAGHDLTIHNVTTDTGNCARCHGNDGTPANDVRGIHATCATCHDNASYPGIITGKTSNCVDCHKTGLVAEPHAGSGGNYSPYDANHYVGTESTHTVSAAQAATVYDGYACSACHKSEMKPEHFKASSLVPGVDKCVGCHEVKVDSLGTWDDTCDACHTATPHTERTTKHDVTANACTGAGCHSVDISVIHANSIPANSMTPNCATCHTNNSTVPTELDCGAAGCHLGMSAHGHTLAASTYNNTTVTGCTDAGAGCHGAAPANYQEIHPASGCTSGACHTAANHNLAQFNDPNTCMNCHGGGAVLYDGAPDVVGLMDTGTSGHYNETTHTASGMTNVVRGTTNGTASATCTNCHNGVSAAPDGFYTQHQGVRTGSLTCSDCHNKNAAIQTIVTDTTRTDTCVACHNGTVVETQHATANAPAVLATSSLSCGATGLNCHVSYDLHELHKSASAGCNLTGCHDYTKQGIKPTGKTCGQVGGCHTTYTVNSHAHATDAAKHQPTNTTQAASTTFASTACGACHDIRNSNSSLTLEHNLATSAKTTNATNVCRNCHNNAASTTAITSNWSAKDTTLACAQCHTAALAIHTDTNSTAHSDVLSAGCSNSGSGCHPTADLSQVGTPSTTANIHSTCLRCHDRTATAPNLAYNPANDTCGSGRECHATATQYNTATLVHNGSGGLADGNDAAHHTAVGMSAKVDGTTYDTGGGNTCASCHSAALKTSHATSSVGAVSCSTGGTGSLGCHNSTAVAAASTQVKASWTNDTCADCHTTSHTTYTLGSHTALLGTAGTADGCANAGCHNTGATTDVRAIHNRATANRGCSSAGTDSNGWSGSCHDLNKDMPNGTIGCGSGTSATTKCHVNHTNSNHMPQHDAASATSIGCTTSGCHETVTLTTIHAAVADGCQPCHGGAGYTDIHTTAGNFECVTCHNGTLVGGHIYNPYDANHYTPAVTQHTASGTETGINNTGGYACTQCHSLEMKPAHNGPTAIAFNLSGYADKCVACHEIKVDNLVGAWDKRCQACHTTATVHNALGTAHNASAETMASPGSVFGGGGGGALGAGFTDGFESNDFASWSSVQSPGAGGWVTDTLENFASNMNNWTITGGGNNSWYWTNAEGNPSGTAIAGDQNTARTSANTQMTLPVSLGGYTAARVSFDFQYWSLENTNDYMRFEYSTNGGTNWTTAYEFLATGTGQSSGAWLAQGPYTVPTNATHIRFDFQNNRENDLAAIDNVLIEGQSVASAGGWTTQNTVVNAGSFSAKAAGGSPMDADGFKLIKTGIDNANAATVDVSYAIRWNTLESADDVIVEYTTNAGASWTTLKDYAPAAADPATQAWKTESFTGLPAGIDGLRVRFIADSTAGDLLYLDAVSVTPVAAGGGASSAGASCQNNPSGAECHVVTDVAAIHAATTAKCTICHKNNTTLPTKNCQAAGCHVGVNLDEHIQTGVGTPAHHENGGTYTSFATGNECSGCHDDSIANEHFVLTANTAKPCSVCHTTNYTVGTYSPAKATVTAQIAAKTITCNGCHTASTQASPHRQRMGTTTTLGSTQFDNTWSGHRSFAGMPGSLTSAAYGTWSLPTATSWLQTGWTTTNKMVLCTDCHGSVAGAAGPHGAAMSVNIAAGYDNSYSDGSLYIDNSRNMSNTTNICAKCHTTTGLGYNSVHSRSDHYGSTGRGACINCHVRTPHAWKRPRLIGYRSDPAPYRSLIINGITGRAYSPTGWSKDYCGVTGCGSHNTNPTGTLWP